MKQRARGYLLLESAFAGGLLLAAMSVAVALVVQARATVSASSNGAQAAALLRSKSDEIASQTTCTASSTLVDVGAGFPGFKWSWSAGSSGVMSSSSPALSATVAPLCEVSVTVEYPVVVRSRDDATDGVAGNGRAQMQISKMWRP